jgi:hypothetical protein
LAEGVVLRWATPVSAIDASTIKASGRTVRCRWMLGADGTNSRVRRWAALEPAWSSVMRVGVRQHFRVTPWTDFVEVHWRDRCQAYITPVGPHEICIALIGSRAGVRFADLPTMFPELGRRLAGATPTGSTRGAISVSTRLRRVIRGRLALIGDASGSVDAITGEGLALAFRQATILAEALSKDDLTIYQAAHQRISRMPRLMSRLMRGWVAALACGAARCACCLAGRARSTGYWRFTWARYSRRLPHWTSSALPGGCWRRMGWVAATIRIDNATGDQVTIHRFCATFGLTLAILLSIYSKGLATPSNARQADAPWQAA